MMKNKKLMSKKTTASILSIILLIIVTVALFGYIVPSAINAQNTGKQIGDRAGSVVGKVLGSYDGITTGLKKGADAGKEEGLSAKDTKSVIQNSFKETDKLEVLEAGVKLKDVNTIRQDYAALFILKGIAIYSVDLSKADINDEGTDDIRIRLPDVEVEIYIDESETEKLAEYQKHSWTGSTKDGLTAYMNSRAAMDESVKETMNNYAQLKETAEKSAIKQVESIAKAATGNKKSVIVDFKEKDDEE